MAAVGLFALIAQSAWAQPYTPTDDDVVLERLDASPPLRQRPQAGTKVDLAVRLARLHIERARASGDPRELGYAQGLLRPWWDHDDAPAPVLVLRATLRQARHDFDGALEDLDRVIAQQPQDAQAWLTRATVLRVQGRYPEALDACTRLQPLADPFIGALCTQAVRSLSGQLSAALTAMSALRPQVAAQPASIAAWFEAEHALMSVRAARTDDAAALFAAALIRHPDDLNLRAEYADLLLQQGQPAAVLELIPASVSADALLLRRALALHALSHPDFAALSERIVDGFAAARRRDDALHLREEARFLLATTSDTAAALRLAQDNWRIQREPADALLLLQAAQVAEEPAAAEPVRQWLAQTGLEDACLPTP